MKRIIGFTIFLIGLVIFIYPAYKNYINNKQYETLLNDYDTKVLELKSMMNDDLIDLMDIQISEEELNRVFDKSDSLDAEDINHQTILVEAITITDFVEDEENEDDVEEDEKPITREERNAYIKSAWPIDGVLSIESIDLIMPVITGASINHLDVSISSLDGYQNWNNGNYAIAGHRSLRYGSHFNRLNEVKIDDIILFYDRESILHEYIVYETKIVHETDMSVLKYQGFQEITLITCDPIHKKNPEYRLIVKAKIQ